MSWNDLSEYDDHIHIFHCEDSSVGLDGYIAIHRGGKVTPAFGATRIWKYSSNDEALSDALKLSRIMSYKSALAGLGVGGAKAVLRTPDQKVDKKTFLEAYARCINTLPLLFITGADVGVTPDDVQQLSQLSDRIVGSGVDPVFFTAQGLLFGLQVSLNRLFNSPSFEGRTFAIQGLGKVGFALLQHVAPHAKKVFVTDINAQLVKEALLLGKHIEAVPPEKIYTCEVDVFAPCALSNSINQVSISLLQCKAIVGSANCQLADDKIGDELYKKGILYAPDYVVNAGGLISVVDEYNYRQRDSLRIENQVTSIGNTLEKIFNEADTRKLPPHRVANEKAKKISDAFQ